jgi:hypothetical protein
MLPDQGCYEERYRLTGSAALGLAASLLSIGLGLLWHTPLVFAVAAVILAAVATQGGGVVGAARRMIAFRADQAGITLGAMPGRLIPRHGAAVFVPWADIEQIILYPVHPRGQGRYVRVSASASSAGTEPRPCPGATSRPLLPGAGRGGRSDPAGHRLAAGPRTPSRRYCGGRLGHPHHRRQHGSLPGD